MMARTMAAALLATLLLVACTGEDEPVILQVEELTGSYSEQNLALARNALDVGRERWNSFDPFAHVLSIGYFEDGQLVIEFDENGTIVSEEVRDQDLSGFELDNLPRSVDEIFDLLDEVIAGFEDGTTLLPDEGECGHHFSMHFDTDLGVPRYYDSLGPCDDGVGVQVVVTRVNSDG